MSTEENNSTLLERLLAYSALAIIAVAVVSFIATLVVSLAGANPTVLVEGFWPIVAWVGYVGVPIGFVLIFLLLIINRGRRKRELRASQPKRHSQPKRNKR